MRPPRLCSALLCLVAMVGAPTVSQAAIGTKLRPGDTCTVAVDEAPVKKGGRVVATLTKGDRVKILKVYGRTMVRAEVKVDGAPVAVLMKTADLSLDQDAPRGEQAEPRKPRKPKKIEETEAEEEKDDDEEDAEEEKKPRRRRRGRRKGGSGGTWARFRGPNGDGVSSETGLLTRWPSGGPKLLWEARGCGQGYASIAVADGLVYTAGNIDGNMTVLAFDTGGKGKWRSPVDRAYTGGYPGSRSTPVVDEGLLFYETPNAKVVCLDASSGKEKWSLDMRSRYRPQRMGWAHSESPLVDGDNLVCCPGGREVGVVALNKKTGSIVWEASNGGDPAGYACPVAVEHKGRRQLLIMTGKAAIGMDPKNGKLLWRFEHPTKYAANIPNPIFYEGKVFITSGYGQGSAFVSPSGRRSSAVWEEKALDNHHGGVVLVDGHIYGHGNRGGWMCVDLRSGDVKYSERGAFGKGAVTYADGMLYCLSEKDGNVGLVKATPDGFDVISSFSIPNGRGQKDVWAHPVVCDGRLYIRNKDLLFAYDIKK